MDLSNFNPLEVRWGQRSYESRNPKDPTACPGSLVQATAGPRAFLSLRERCGQVNLSSYGSALNSYLNFVRMHDFPVEPTTNTLLFFTVYMCHCINPRSVNTYLSGITQQLKADFPTVKEARNSALVRRTLQGCMRMKGRTTVRKHALTTDDLHLVVNHYRNSTLHDNLAMALAEHGVSPAIIQASGRWASEAFWVYIRKNPTLLQGLVHARTAVASASAADRTC